MKDTKTVLDNVRSKIPGDAKLLVVYIGRHGELQCSQANCSQADISLMVESLRVNMLTEKVGKVG